LPEKGDDKVRIRVLSSQQLPYHASIQNRLKWFFNFGKKQLDQIVIHVHGGGFIAMTSRSHQTYTRRWANLLQVPFFSIDYKKAPQHPYPEALDDVWQAYR